MPDSTPPTAPAPTSANPTFVPTQAGGEGAPVVRVRLPVEGELLGVVLSTLGGGRLQVSCKDGKERICRIPGKIRRNIWVRQGDIVVVKRWDIDGEKRGDIIWRYNRLQADWLRAKGYIK